MPFIGKQPAVGSFTLLDSITTSATATYALTKNGDAFYPETSRNLVVSLNGVTQAPEDAYTVSGSNIVFASALTASDVIDYILVLGDVLDIGTPSDGTVGTSQMNYPLGNFSSTGIDDNATGERLEVNDGNVIFKANSGSRSHAFGYNEDGGEIILYDEAGAVATLIDQASNNTRVLELINGSDLLLGLGGSNSTGTVKFMRGGYAEAMRIDSTGGLRVGLTTNIFNQPSSEKFSVKNTGLGCAASFEATNVTGGYPIMYVRSTDATAGSQNAITFYRTNSVAGYISTTTTSTSYNTSSDYRLKENVVDLDNAKDRLNQIPVHRFNFIADPDTTVDGFLAHEVAEVVPEAISGAKDEVDDEGNPVYQGIDQSKLVPLLTAALQEALTKIDELETRIVALEAV